MVSDPRRMSSEEEMEEKKSVHSLDVTPDFQKSWLRRRTGETESVRRCRLCRGCEDSDGTGDEESPGLGCVHITSDISVHYTGII